MKQIYGKGILYLKDKASQPSPLGSLGELSPDVEEEDGPDEDQAEDQDHNRVTR